MAATPISVTAGDVHRISGTQKVVTAGATITAGQPVYKNTNTGKYEAAHATILAKSLAEGIALTGSSDLQPLVIQTTGIIDIGGTVLAGVCYVVDDTAGGIVEYDRLQGSPGITTGDFVTVLGVGNDATNKYIELSIVQSGVALA